MNNQLILVHDDGTDWRLDEHTKQVGRQGLAAARDALAQAVRRATGATAAEALDRAAA